MSMDAREKNIETFGVFIPGFSCVASPFWKTGFQDMLIDLDGNINQNL